MPSSLQRPRRPTGFPYRRATHLCCVGLLVLAMPAAASAATLAERAKEAGCAGKPKQVDGASLFKCETAAGVSSFFNVPEITGPGSIAKSAGSGAGNGASAAPAPKTVSGFPRIDAETQKGRDDVRRRVLREELAAEEKLLAEARMSHADGAPAPLPEERANADKYRERIGRLRQAVVLHERNVEALKKEIAGLR
ncbi:MAG: hypothetical protein ABJC33_11610 [Betaproteobacteria bacterium]